MAVILLNVPTISYSAANGFGLNLLSFKFLLGFSFNYMGYLNAAWAIGIPLGAIYWLWKLNRNKPIENDINPTT